MAEKTKNIGIKVKGPAASCTDEKCPFHGKVKIRGKTFSGIVERSRMDKSAVVSWERRRFVKKYERFEKRRTKIKVHNPPCIDAKEGDIVRIAETRPLSKTIHFVIVEKIGEDRFFEGKEEENEVS